MHFTLTPSSIKKKLLLLPGSFGLLAAGFALLLHFTDENRRFEKMADHIFQQEMTANTLNMHYTLAYPENFGITEYEAVLPCYSLENSQASVTVLDNYLQQLESINPHKLNSSNFYTYQLLTTSLEHSRAGSSYAYFEEPLSPSSGMQSQLPILLAEYTFRGQQDVEDYLSLLDQTDEYFASLAVYEQEKAAAGLLQADTSLEQVIRQCSSILSKKELSAGTHFLQTTFAERIQSLVEDGIVTKDKAEYYLSANNRLLTTVMQPAYDQLADDLFLLMGDGTSTPKGLSSYPGGQEYYAYLVQEVTGSSRSIEEIKTLLYPAFEAEYEALRSLLRSRTDSVDVWQASMTGTVFPCQETLDILADLQKRMATDFPVLPTGSFPSPAVKTVAESLADYCAPAFYLTPPLDDTDSNVIYVNPKSTSEGLELYTTLAHEGYPGHLYQSVYNRLTMQAQDTHPVRQILWYGGYLEGWALYVEFRSYDYAASLATENGQPDVAYAYEIEKHNRNMQLCLYSLLDVAIHYDNASYEQVHEVLSGFGISNPTATRAVYDYIAEEPANYLKYYLGYQEILSLQEKARTLWQEDYSDMRFHQFFLDCGPSDFDTLESTLS